MFGIYIYTMLASMLTPARGARTTYADASARRYTYIHIAATELQQRYHSGEHADASARRTQHVRASSLQGDILFQHI